MKQRPLCAALGLAGVFLLAWPSLFFVGGRGFAEEKTYAYPQVKALAEQKKTKEEIRQALGPPNHEEGNIWIYGPVIYKRPIYIEILFDDGGRSVTTGMRPARMPGTLRDKEDGQQKAGRAE